VIGPHKRQLLAQGVGQLLLLLALQQGSPDDEGGTELLLLASVHQLDLSRPILAQVTVQALRRESLAHVHEDTTEHELVVDGIARSLRRIPTSLCSRARTAMMAWLTFARISEM